MTDETVKTLFGIRVLVREWAPKDAFLVFTPPPPTIDFVKVRESR